jgi:glycosyltransferase involved in cell wall biosynthesis
MPVRHFHRAYFEEALASVLGQTSPRWRLLVVDDGAHRPGFDEVIAPLLADVRVRVVRSDRPGLAGALNTGFRAARTDFAAILFADDLWAPDAVAVLTDAIERHPDVDVFHASRRFVDEEGRPLSTVYEAREHFTLDEFVRGSPVKHLLCIRCRTALGVGGIDETLEPFGPDDYDFPWTLAEAGARFRAVPECLYLIRDHRASFRLTTHVPRRVQAGALRRILRKHGVGRVHTEFRVWRARRGYLRQSIYRSTLDRWLKARSNFDAGRGWREPYR